ncbi:hypothetical protein F511_24062 [Dorcoceras hygrometricum]|uniref:Uncharacterized protein n=1 Tax=Dorcoceras hygrometricum TaxID=472368 RepID=A0A2Z7BLL0_9LAMI|nr:hypothetical protein F511_24062 [Dorcoceras hygrometricum]
MQSATVRKLRSIDEQSPSLLHFAPASHSLLNCILDPESDDEVQCLITDDTDKVFDFSNLEFTREDLFIAINDIVHEYKKFSQSFEEVKAEKESHASKDDLESSSELQTALSKKMAENDELRNMSQEIMNENQRLAETISSLTKSSASLQKL